MPKNSFCNGLSSMINDIRLRFEFWRERCSDYYKITIVSLDYYFGIKSLMTF